MWSVQSNLGIQEGGFELTLRHLWRILLALSFASPLSHCKYPSGNRDRALDLSVDLPLMVTGYSSLFPHFKHQIIQLLNFSKLWFPIVMSFKFWLKLELNSKTHGTEIELEAIKSRVYWILPQLLHRASLVKLFLVLTFSVNRRHHLVPTDISPGWRWCRGGR